MEQEPMEQETVSDADRIRSGAGFWIRALARILDMLWGVILGLVGGVLAAAALAIMQTMGHVAPGWEQRVQGFSLFALLAGLLGGILYHALCEGMYGATLGKLICRLRVLQRNGNACDMDGAVVRNLGWLVDGLFFGAVGLSSMGKTPLNQRYGDVWAQTVVVKASDVPASSERTTLHFIGGLLLGSGCWFVLSVLGLVLRAR